MAVLLQFLYVLVQALQPYLWPLCFVITWLVIVLGIWSVISATVDVVKRSQQLHQIPCSHCQFFTGDYHLKCTVHPSSALTEDAIDCPDQRPVTNPFTAKSEH